MVPSWQVTALFKLRPGTDLDLHAFHDRVVHLEPQVSFLDDDEVIAHLFVRARSLDDAAKYVRDLLGSERSRWWSKVDMVVEPA